MLESVRQVFENAYDIPFICTKSQENNELVYFVGPKSLEMNLFDLKIAFKNELRLVMELIPDKFSKPLIQDMGLSNDEQKSSFLNFVKTFVERKAKIEISVNGSSLNLTKSDNWPNNWNHIAIRISRSPLSDGKIEYEDVIADWGLLMMGMVLSLANIVPLDHEASDFGGELEGAITRAISKKYERNPINRTLCLINNGYDCKVCGFSFAETYGNIGNKFIHVHHIVPVSQMGGAYMINPSKDLVPVCANCHAMLHKKNPPYTVNELQNIIKK